MQIFLQDHQDSFTYNLADYLSYFCSTIKVLSIENYVKSTQLTENDLLVLGPGPGKPQDYPQLMNLLQQKIPCPLLGVCLGHQALGLHYGGKLYSSSPKFGISEDLWLGDQKTKYHYTRYHSWSVELPKSSPLRILSRSKVDKAIMMVADFKSKRFGIQFHPESIGSKIPVDYLLKIFGIKKKS